MIAEDVADLAGPLIKRVPIFVYANIIQIFVESFDYNTASYRILEKSGIVCEASLEAMWSKMDK